MDGRKFFKPVAEMRTGVGPSKEIVREAEAFCKGGTVIQTLFELWTWMQLVNPEVSFFRAELAQGAYPEALAAFVVSSRWIASMKHAVWALHGELFIRRLVVARDSMTDDSYRDNYAGALNHRATGLAHMVKCAKIEGQSVVQLPCWDQPRPLASAAAQAVTDARQACTLRSEKYGKKNSSSAFCSYQAILRNLADALEIHADVTGSDLGPTGPAWLRQKAETLALTDPRILATCDKGETLTVTEERRITKDLRLAQTAATCVACTTGGDVKDSCSKCGTNRPTHIGFSCRCLCLCVDCAKAAGTRVQECPVCGDYTEFVAAV